MRYKGHNSRILILNTLGYFQQLPAIVIEEARNPLNYLCLTNFLTSGMSHVLCANLMAQW